MERGETIVLQDQDAEQVRNSGGKPATPEAAMKIWRDAIADLPPLDFDQIKQRLSQFRVKIPEDLLTYDSYIRAVSRLQNVRSELLEIKEIVDDHSVMKERAVKSLQKILVAMSEGKTVAEKEGETEAWLIHLQKLVARSQILKIMTYDTLENIDMAIMQLGRQIKVADTAVRAQTIDNMSAVDLPNDWGNMEDDSDSTWILRSVDSRRAAG